MSETLDETLDPEQRVFGGVFSTELGIIGDQEALERFYADRIAAISRGETVWLPRVLDSDGGVVADLRDGMIHVTLDFRYATRMAHLYVTSKDGVYGDIAIIDPMPFDEAVQVAEGCIT
jgi:hypothetical protein